MSRINSFFYRRVLQVNGIASILVALLVFSIVRKG